MVARALLLRPRAILADEPVSMVDASLRAIILESLRTLNRELGICLVYITHDLTTAYQICDHIVVLYRGSVVEAGPVDPVIRHPRHPYTQLLVESIPRADPDRRWPDDAGGPPPDRDRVPARGCKFADRCPAVMTRCRSETPPLYRVDGRAARCFLHDAWPPIDGEPLLIR
jgi:peptide/nickel transport system ATP-binding protein